MINFLGNNPEKNFDDFEQEIAELNKVSENYNNLLESLKASEEKYRFLTENSADIIWQVDKEYRFIYVSPMDEKIRGFTQEEVIGKTIWEFIGPEFAKQINKNFAIRDEKIRGISDPVRYELPLLCKDGSYVWMEINVNPIVNSTNEITGYNGVSRDITERKKYEQEIKNKSKELKESNDAKDKFFSIIAHDLRSPFQGLMGLSDILLSEYDSMPKENLKEHLALLNKSIYSQYRLLEDLLNWSRIQSGKMKCMPRKLNILETVNLAIANLLQNAKSKNIEITVEINKYLTVNADLDMFLLLVRNLFSNAIKFTNPCGKIQILTGNLNNDLFIEIRDNGIGIDKENMDKLFRLDVSFSMTGTNNENGSGLGLLLCKEIIDRHNGKIWVESEIEKGSSFKFIFQKE